MSECKLISGRLRGVFPRGLSGVQMSALQNNSQKEPRGPCVFEESSWRTIKVVQIRALKTPPKSSTYQRHSKHTHTHTHIYIYIYGIRLICCVLKQKWSKKSAPNWVHFFVGEFLSRLFFSQYFPGFKHIFLKTCSKPWVLSTFF